MKIIEIYDKEHPVYNIMAQAIYPDAEFIYIGVKNLLSKNAQQGLRAYFKARKCKKDPSFILLDEEAVEAIGLALNPIVAEEGCYIELRGGTEVMCVSMGVLAERYNLSMFQINPNTAKVRAITGTLPNVEPQTPNLKYEELVCLTGGCIGSGTEDYSVIVDDDTEKAVTSLWKRYAKNPGNYNRKNNRLAGIVNSRSTAGAGHSINIDADGVSSISERDFNMAVGYINQLEQEGVIDVAKRNHDGLIYDYKNDTCKAMIEKSGLLLELFARISAVSTGRFSDVRQGVRLDWDGKLNENGTVSGTNNEVDLIFVDCFKVYYVSCKSGYFDKSALYELETVAAKFDTGNVKKILICDEIDDFTKERAQDMRIQVVSGITGFSTFEDLGKKLLKMA